jgi:hypothetical protein
MDIVPSEPFSKALAYARNREHELRCYLSDAAVPIDTNHLERKRAGNSVIVSRVREGQGFGQRQAARFRT